MEQLGGTHRECRTDYSDDRHACFLPNFVVQMHFATLRDRQQAGSERHFLHLETQAAILCFPYSPPYLSFPFVERSLPVVWDIPGQVIKKFRITLTGNDQQGDEHEIGEESGSNKTKNG